MSELVLSYRQRTTPDGAAHVVDAAHPTLPADLTARGVEFIHDGQERLPEPAVLDGYLFFWLLYGMQHADRIRVEGPVSAEALRNARAVQEYWACWLPERYRIVDIEPESVTPESDVLSAHPNGLPDRAVAAFSGGVDSIFTLLRHAGGWLGNAAYPVRHVVMVHGFDVVAADRDGFDRLQRRVQPLLDALGVQAHVVRTNARDVRPRLDWEHGHGAQLACVLHQFAPQFNRGILGSTDPVHRQVIGWGSNPTTDQLLSGAQFRIVHDGAGYDRSQKIMAVADHRPARMTMKVCWQGADPARNCGTCDKCMRTRLVFALRGDPAPPCFDTPFDPADVDRILDARPSVLHSVGLLDVVRASSIDEPWVHLLEVLLTERTEPYRLSRSHADVDAYLARRERQEAELTALRADNEELAAENSRMSTTLDAVVGSTSWRLTAPLRRTMQRATRRRRRGPAGS